MDAWLSDKVKLHRGVTVRASELGGNGIFYNGETPESDIIIATISKSAVFDYELLLETLNTLKIEDPQLSKIVVGFLSTIEPSTETEVLMCYFWAFTAAYKAGSTGFVSLIQPYLNLLEHTQVDIPQGNTEDDDWFIKSLASISKAEREKYEAMLLWLDSEVAGKSPWSQHFSFDLFWQIYKAIKSRVLEIPHSLSEDLGDFVTNISLVPFLDYANHLAAKNAYFDVDRRTEDIVLKIDHTKLEEAREHAIEVLISYSPIEKIQSFLMTYGFVPRNHGQMQVFDWKICDFDKLMNDFCETRNVPYKKIGKWLQVIPGAQLVIQDEHVKINLTANPFTIFFADNLTYNEHWGSGVTNDNLQKILGLQEEKFDIIHGPGPLGVLCDGRPIETSIDPLSPDLVERAINFLQTAAKLELRNIPGKSPYHEFKKILLQKVSLGLAPDFIDDLEPIPVNQIEF